MADSSNMTASKTPPSPDVGVSSPRSVLHEADELVVDPHPRDLKRAYDELRIQYQRCATALATAAHDLRTPLAVISGYVELLVNGKLGPINEKQQHVLEDMQVSSTRLQRLVTDFLTFASLQTDTVPLRTGPVQGNSRPFYRTAP